MSLEKEFVPYEQALALKELGFDEPCFGFYTYKGEIRRYTNFDSELNEFQTLKNSKITMGGEWCTAPTFSQAFRWFREKYDLRFYIVSNADHEIYGKDTYDIVIFEKFGRSLHNEYDDYESYEEAELACLKKLIEIVKEKQP